MQDICCTAPGGAATHKLGTDALSSLWRTLLEQSGQAVTELPAPDDGLWMLLFVNHLLWIEAGLIDQGLTLL